LAAHGKVGVLLLAMVVVRVQLPGPAAAVGQGRRLKAPASSNAEQRRRSWVSGGKWDLEFWIGSDE
jgi:hypothetical protein